MAECPSCKSVSLARDPDWGLIILTILTFPFGLLFLLFTQNRRCMSCGVRFRIMPGSINVPITLAVLLLFLAIIATVCFVLQMN